MDDIEEIINKELDEKSIEKEPTITSEIHDEPSDIEKPKKSKKVRSQAQIEAFEKARIKRAENYEKRKLLKEAEKQEKKEVKTKIKEEINNLSTEEIKEKIKPKPKPNVVSQPVMQAPPQYTYQQQPTPIINNYYYNTPPHIQEEIVKKGRKKKVVYVSDSDEEIPNEPAPAPAPPPPNPQPVKKAPINRKPVLKYNFAG
tara:strand:- start:2786 stop:3385 length:600 start_codon:yes stop_codon:yes gene_type:complete